MGEEASCEIFEMVGARFRVVGVPLGIGDSSAVEVSVGIGDFCAVALPPYWVAVTSEKLEHTVSSPISVPGWRLPASALLVLPLAVLVRISSNSSSSTPISSKSLNLLGDLPLPSGDEKNGDDAAEVCESFDMPAEYGVLKGDFKGDAGVLLIFESMGDEGILECVFCVEGFGVGELAFIERGFRGVLADISSLREALADHYMQSGGRLGEAYARCSFL